LRGFTRLTTAFQQAENHEHWLALHYMYYQFVRIHGGATRVALPVIPPSLAFVISLIPWRTPIETPDV